MGKGGKTRYGDPKFRSLTREERHLWREVAKDVTPLASSPPPAPGDPDDGAEEFIAKSKQAAGNSPSAPSGSPRSTRFPKAPPAAARVPDLAPIDRRTSKKLVRGQLTPESTLDLHGETRASAPDRLYRFLNTARTRGDRLVLVITGKGNAGAARHTLHSRDFFHDPERATVLRELFPAWLAEARFRALVTGFQPAHPRHGGGGAFYVRLRRRDR